MVKKGKKSKSAQQCKLAEKVRMASRKYKEYKKSNPNGGKKWKSFVKEAWGK